jgi:hypothetical protein
MNKDEIFQKLTQLFATKINYSGEFNSLFFIETEQSKLKINFLNNQHYDFILKYLINDILVVVNGEVRFGYLNLKTSPITLKNPLQEEVNYVIEPVKIKPKEKVELPTIKNRTIKQIEQFLFDEGDKILSSQKEIRERDENYLENKWYYSNYGQIQFISHLYSWMQKIKDFDED